MFDAKKLLTDMLGGGNSADGATEKAKNALGDIGGIVGSVFGQAKDGLQEGVSEIESRTGIGEKADGALEQATGKSASDLINQAREFAANNKLATGAAVGGLAALLLGTRAGRGVTGSAAKIGGLALIGGLAYKAYKNHADGKPLLDAPAEALDKAPDESPFGETGDSDQDQKVSILILRSMIASAAADGLIDNEERSRIVGTLESGGMDVNAAKFLDHEFATPASVSDLAAQATSTELKMQVYTAARIGMDTPSEPEKQFLIQLAAEMGLSADQVEHLEGTVASARSA